jgi:prepilin signal peptidase PulO-like enzyme (type II secretory pathway)
MFFTLQPSDWIVTGLVIAFLLPIIVIDLSSYLIPDALVFPGIAAVLVYYILSDISKVLPALVHGAVAFAIILVFWFFSKKQIGFGDAKLSFLIAAGLGFFEWWGVLMVGSLTAMAFGIIKVKTGRMTLKDKLPLAPFFGIGTAAVVLGKLIFFSRPG